MCVFSCHVLCFDRQLKYLMSKHGGISVYHGRLSTLHVIIVHTACHGDLLIHHITSHAVWVASSVSSQSLGPQTLHACVGPLKPLADVIAWSGLYLRSILSYYISHVKGFKLISYSYFLNPFLWFKCLAETNHCRKIANYAQDKMQILFKDLNLFNASLFGWHENFIQTFFIFIIFVEYFNSFLNSINTFWLSSYSRNFCSM